MLDINLLQSEKLDIETFLARPDAYADDSFADKSRRLAEINSLLDLSDKLSKAESDLVDARADSSLADLIPDLEAELAQTKNGLENLLVPRDPADDKPAIIEIRAGAGGDEASLFAGELHRMYSRYAETHGLKNELQSENLNDAGGFKEIIFRLSGNRPYGQLKFEGGVHRVQRIPTTESQGRIHTSTVTVAVLPEAEEKDIEIRPEDLRVDIYRAGGHGGQSVNTTDSAIRITHLPTGIVVSMQDERSQLQNRLRAMTVLRTRLAGKQLTEELAKNSAERKSLIGTGDRSEKIRTYNFPQDRITDHRIHYSRSNISTAMDGDIDDLIQELQTHECSLSSNTSTFHP